MKRIYLYMFIDFIITHLCLPFYYTNLFKQVDILVLYQMAEITKKSNSMLTVFVKN